MLKITFHPASILSINYISRDSAKLCVVLNMALLFGIVVLSVHWTCVKTLRQSQKWTTFPTVALLFP